MELILYSTNSHFEIVILAAEIHLIASSSLNIILEMHSDSIYSSKPLQ